MLSEKPVLQLLSAMSVMQAFQREVIPAWEVAGRSVAVNWMPTALIVERFTSGETCDIAIVTREAMEQLVQAGKIIKGSVRDLVSSQIGFAVAPGIPQPDLSSVNSFMNSLLSYSRIAFSERGASGILFVGLMERLGISDDIKSRTVPVYAGLCAEKIISGEADIAVQQVSELLTVPGITLAGALPEEYGCNLSFSVGICCATMHQEAGEQFIQFLLNDSARDSYRRSGLTPV
ncbi:substrate-binding domain-containing protein [Cedecea neteri]|uniref:molybdate ABC transporter substrate-binding protein n=1 Tax=Cedecea neteri TaxID=158822 RepID=UPI0028933547|nr:substrate-binding domain-containing protein [Cedecea neteri]WNJ78023.1 substrate-binding domain-containing protein [Cedecea neteri]